MRSVAMACAALLLAVALLPASAILAQTRPLIMIDPGHGGTEIGVEHEGILEKDLILQISFVLAAELTAAGYDVAFTRTADGAVAWPDRRSRAESAGADLLIMMHINGDAADPAARGGEVYWSPASPIGTAAASPFADAYREAGIPVLEEAKPGWDFLASPTVPTVMIETLFLTNAEDAALLQTSDGQHRLARILVEGTRRAVPAAADRASSGEITR